MQYALEIHITYIILVQFTRRTSNNIKITIKQPRATVESATNKPHNLLYKTLGVKIQHFVGVKWLKWL